MNNQFTTDPMLAEVQAVYKTKTKPSDRVKLSSSRETARYLRSVWNDSIEHHEEMVLLMLNTNGEVLGWARVSIRGLACTIADPKIIFQFALLANASSIILAHNHPSGNNKPGQEDINLTRRITEAGKLLEIKVLDHIILTLDNYFSFTEDGLI